jgi:hypothetical protein
VKEEGEIGLTAEFWGDVRSKKRSMLNLEAKKKRISLV